MGGSKLDANTYLKWITFKCKSTSRMLSVLNAFPSSVLWCTKSYDQTWLRYSGRSRTHEPSFSQSRPFLGCFIGTLSPSRRHSRSTRLSFTRQPASLSRAAIRR